MDVRSSSSCLFIPIRLVVSAVCALLALNGGADAQEIGDLRTLNRVLAGTGFGVDSLLRRHAQEGQGGPFVPDAARPPPDRWDQLQRALMVLPLASPLGEYQVSSRYGRRKDPFNHRRAMHTGVDLRAAVRAPVHATAPGRVVFAGRRSGYGRMVEIDHGLGVRTRYAHLARITVRPGQAVVLGGRIGLLGSSGRSTGPHLHYEVLVDGRPRDPQPFLRAGNRLNDSVLLSTDRRDRDSRVIPNSRGCPCP